MPLYDRLENWFIHLSQVMFLIEMTAQLLLPCILMEMIKEQLECTRIALNHRMLKETVHVRASLAALGVARDPAGHAAAARRAQHLRHLPHRHHTVHTLVLMQLLQYMSARRLQHSAWRVIPLDMQLPLAVLSTCVTYLIVIIQFTHLY
ncbi:hypothetical protein NE865_14340 [Phthorimaea operculella]|nr:hypothetical protein NE865_14340 [Phthorimaea operculella]